MRSLIVLGLIVSTGLLINQLFGAYGDIFAIVAIFLLLIMARTFGPFKREKYAKHISHWLASNGVESSNVEPKSHMFFNGKLFFKASDAQLVFSYKDNSTEYWFACGGWWLGSYQNKLTVYRYTDNQLKLLETQNA